MGDLALKNRVADVSLDISSDNANIRYVKKESIDLQRHGFSSDSIEGPENTSGTNRLRRRLSSSNPNKTHSVHIPSEFLDITDQEYST